MKAQICVRSFCAIFAICLLVDANRSSAQEPSFRPKQAPRPVPGELIIKYRNAGFGRVAAESVQQSVSEKHKFQTLSTVPYFGIQRVKVEPDRIERVINELRRDEAIAFVTRNYIVYPDQTAAPPSDDPGWKDLWGMQKIGMPAAWTKTKGSAHVVVAVLDTGVDSTHPDLAANLWKTPSGDFGMSFCTDFSDENNPKVLPPQPGAMDRNGHGTHVAGTIAAIGNNKTDVVGVAWELKIMALKFLCGADGRGTTADAIRAMEYAMTNGAHILNNSWGGAPRDIALETAIQETNARGLLFVASAGNNGKDQGVAPNYPAAYRVANVIAVGATDDQDKMWSFSNWSATLVPIAAPGVQILSTLPNKSTGKYNGTSMAAPHVSGCAALLKSLDMKRQAAELKRLLLDAVDPVSALKGKVEKGRLNCGKAVQ